MTNTAPPFGTEITHPGGEAVFAKLVQRENNELAFSCGDCVFGKECPRQAGRTSRPCIGGVYLDKVQYLGLKLTGVIK